MHCNGNQSYPNDSPLGVKTKSQVCSHEIWSRIGVGLFKQVCVSSFASSLVTYISPFLSVLCVFWIIDFPATGVQVFTGIQVVCWKRELARGRGVAEGVKLHPGIMSFWCTVQYYNKLWIYIEVVGFSFQKLRFIALHWRLIIRWGLLTSSPSTWTASCARMPRSLLTSSPGFAEDDNVGEYSNL